MRRITNKGSKVFALLIVFCMLFFASCGKTGTDGSEKTADYSYTFADSMGNTVELSKKPEKVAVLFSSYADIWKSAGGSVNITVGESVERGFAPEDAVLVDSSAGHTSLDMELLIAENPDLVIGTADYECDADACEKCREAGIPAALFRVECFEDYLAMLKICCDITGCTGNYQRYGLDVKAQIDDILNADIPDGRAPSVLFVRAGAAAKSTKAKTAENNFVCRMLDELGAENIADSAKVLLDGLSLEEIVAREPDIIFVSPMGNEDASREYMNGLLESDGWRELEAVKTGRVVFLPKELFHFKPNARWAEAYKTLYEELYK